MTDHIVQSFDVELRALTAHILELGILAEQQLTDAVWSLRRGNDQMAREVAIREERLDALAARIESDAVSVIARRQPLAIDLRHVMAAIRISSNLERVGDLAFNIAKRSMAMSPDPTPVELAEPMQRMAELTLLQLKSARESFATMDIESAYRVWEEDAVIDAMHTLLFKDIVQSMADNRAPALDLAHLLFVVKNIERVGDHATNIAEDIVYMVSGALPTSKRPKMDGSALSGSVGAGH
ncbi:phosphate signaling complex protein PhoU [Stenotrophomonas sp. NPDC078853]|uniref:phosphate signaling complex protein PhoU n=1 Tax=Stenotrophomonas sp. NPDC078853 TaxID=3364534 RepID=UPI00384B889A